MRLKNRMYAGVVSLAVGAAGMVGGCRSVDPAVDRSQQAADLLVGTRQTMFTGEKTVADSQTALRTLRDSKGDLRPAFEVFLAQLDAVRKQADRMKQESEAVRTEAAVYVSARQTDVSTISNDEMRQAAIQRTANVKEKCDTIKDRYAQVNADFTQYIRSLSDLQTYLGNELNFGALDSGRRWVDDAISSGEMLRGDIRSLALEIELTSNILSPVPLAATQWPTTLQQTNAVAEQH